MDDQRQHVFAGIAGVQHGDPDRPFAVEFEAVPALGLELFLQPRRRRRPASRRTVSSATGLTTW